MASYKGGVLEVRIPIPEADPTVEKKIAVTTA
jgi:HSP20 family molecular chaperone IbpA